MATALFFKRITLLQLNRYSSVSSALFIIYHFSIKCKSKSEYLINYSYLIAVFYNNWFFLLFFFSCGACI